MDPCDWEPRILIDKTRLVRVRSENETSPCIFSASTALLKECKDAYVPQIVSIGPYHRQTEELWPMKELKEEAARRLLVRILVKDGCPASTFTEEDEERFKDEMDNLYTKMIWQIRQRRAEVTSCYDKDIHDLASCCGKDIYNLACYNPIDSLESRDDENKQNFDYVLAKVMVLDACFILEFFRCLFNESVGDSEILERFFPDFGSNFNRFKRSQIMKDLIKVENQIPLFVLEEVLVMEMGGSLEDAKSRLQQFLKAVFNKFYYRPFDYFASGESVRQNHILDIYYHCCLGDEDHREEKQKIEELQEEKQKSKDFRINLANYVEDLKEHQSERHKVPSAVQLEKGGVKIKATGKTVQDIGFEGRTLYIPAVELDSDSEIFIRNLMALENCYPDGSLRRMTAFVEFLNELCQTEKGATVMRENGVIIGNLWQDSQVSRLFSSCMQSHSVPSYYPIEVTRKNLMMYYSRKTRIAAAEAWNEFRKTYFSKPWILIGGIGATIILILTAIQVFCLFHSCGAH